jgi:hypothetical protein
MIRFYIAPRILRTDDSGEYYSSLLNDFIAAGESFSEIDNPARRISICCVNASSTTHAAILADSRVFVASPLANDFAELKQKLETLFNSIAGVATIKTKLENNGINTAWISASSTLRDVLRYLLRIFTIGQLTYGKNESDIMEFLRNNLDTQVVNISLTIRNKVKAWMQSKGLDVSWIVGATTVRQILHYIVTTLSIGKFIMSGEEF